jgi:nitroreductase/Pyruvate/2-oxoacid:ferredoxin oxidoreductase delta subunit
MIFRPESVYRSDLCTACGVCSGVCPADAVRTDSSGRVVSFSSSCIGCGHCGCYCPSRCFGLPAVDDKDAMPEEEKLQFLFKNRRSTRKFSRREIDRAVLTALLEPVGYAPTGQNAQGLIVDVVLGEQKVRQLIFEPFVKLVKLIDCFRLLTVLPGPGKEFVKKLRNGEDFVTWNAPCVLLFRAHRRNVTGRTDAVIAATMVSTKAESMGLGSFWNGIIQIVSPLLGLKRCYAVLCVGYPSHKKFSYIPERDWSLREI